ncbi:hypothetical protein CRE_04157 [Caenorhabditis remanei]|uniref:Sdz-33 F-box domain-containing protein n=1 Tax=Caenorhabditis remanei TaxID=31234 RepID=E3MYQ8_CAERE|nr:hypothetical protein CRE_04157 [Caenorhabditis remanei]
MTTPFRLFSLLYVPLKQVLDNLGPHGIILLSLCSRRSKNLAVSYRGPSKNVQLHLMYGDSFGSLANDLTGVWEAIDIKNLGSVRLGTLPSGKFRDVQYKMDGDCLVTLWEDKRTGLIEIGNYAREIFNQDIYQVSIGDEQAVGYRRLIEWTMDTQKSIERFYFGIKKTLDEDLDYILENLKCTGSLWLLARPSKNYRTAKPLVFNLNDIYICNSFWIKQRDLLGMNCKIITMHNSKLTSEDFNVFLKHWMSGGCSKLKQLLVFVKESINFESVLDGVEFIERGDDVERVLFVEEDRTPQTIRGGFDVKRSNVTATVFVSSGNHFCMIVW